MPAWAHAARSTADWLATFERLDIPAQPVRLPADLLKDPHLTDVGFCLMAGGDKAQGAPDAAYRISIADVDGDGKLSDAELRRGLKVRFDWLDANKDGNVDLDELKAGFGVPMLH